jgi:uncharacterized membrane protein
MPDFWHKELWHPVTVHFPIALLLVATFFLMISFFCKAEYKRFFSSGSLALLILGVGGAWVGIYTGDLADGVVARKLCDPTVLKDHELAAETMTYLFTGAAVIYVFFYFGLFKSRLQLVLPYIIFACMLAGSVFLVRAGHLGALIVYQQGGGVYKHAVDCDEFK